jgi:ubiquinone/menaquinone biosynthesis C-methylase UbiE
VSETARVLRHGGRFYIIDLDPARLPTKLIAFVEKLFAEPAAFTRPEDLVARLKAMGIVGACRFIDNYQYLYEGEKR